MERREMESLFCGKATPFGVGGKMEGMRLMDSFAFSFATAKGNRGSHQFLNWWQQYATGILRFNCSSPCRNQIKKTPEWVIKKEKKTNGLVCISFRYSERK
jgi:hypothetical protein